GDETRDFQLARKIDEFGHGCRSIAFSWVDAQQTTALSGDEFHGRLALPFEFDFYGQSYDQVFISDNGYLTFVRPEFTNPFPVGIPSGDPPDAAIYALWQDLYLDDDSTIEFDTIGSAPDRSFVIEYSDIRSRTSSSARLDLEFKLYERSETMDILYGAANPANPGDGRNATIGIEDATGTDGLQFSFFERRVTAGSAYRYETVPTGQVSGTVLDANDQLPVAGATVTATPGGRSATTDGNGDYTLRLRPGGYTLRATAQGGYRPRPKPVTVTDGGDASVSFRLRAAVAELSIDSITESVEYGETGSATFTLSNPGTAALRWQSRERELDVTPPDLPVIGQTILRRPAWDRFDLPAGLPRVAGPTLDPGLLTPIIEDPAGDATGSVDVTTVRGGSDGTELGVSLEFTEPTATDEAVGFVFFDTDQDESTGLPPEDLFGSPEQDIGFDYFADLFFIHDPDPVVLIVSADFELVAVVPAIIGGGLVAFDVPLEALGADDGSVDVAMILGDFNAPTDLAPDAGHGTIEPFADAPWIDLRPAQSRLAPGARQRLTLSLGGPATSPALYEGILAFLSNAPRQPLLQLPVEFTVGLPDTFGSLRGRVSDAHSGAPLEDARVILHSAASGASDIMVQTNERGRYELFGPAGIWDLEVRLAGHVPATEAVAIKAGQTRRGVDQALHARQPHATLTGDPIEFELAPGGQGSASLALGNLDGHAVLDFVVGEAEVRSGGPAAAGTLTWLHRSSERVTLDANAGGRAIARPSSYRWQTAAPTGASSVLVYADDPVHPAPETYVDLALQRLGLSYTAFYEDWAGFEDALTSSDWDLVLVANDNFPPDVSTLDAMADYVAGGGSMAIDSWTVGFEPDHPLWSLLGFSYVGDDTDPPDPVYWWDPGHPLFTDPETVPEIAERDGDLFGIYGQQVEPTDGTALAGYTTPGPDPNEAALILGASERTIFRAFIDGDNNADLDDDGVLDGIELWANQIRGLVEGFNTDVSWLSVAPTSGQVAVGDSTELLVSVDATGLAPGVYQAQVIARTNDPGDRSLRHPITLVVPRSSVGTNAGGPAYTTSGGDIFRSDRAFTPGSFGYLGTSDESVSAEPIAGTLDDGLYQDARLGMRAYRFDVPDGSYRVDLHFAELGTASGAARRLFDVTVEGDNVLDNLNVAEAAGGRFRALIESFVVTVTDGDLRVGFDAGRGRTLINAIEVTGLP
ncbi:MAG: carboxypeptidase regulatory-like domain-containing protein, partial [Chloroflexi bacterium]|nr:carboxypeptidase regulatory-like domain-containing protein [Chloroflexota bacterium]